MTRPPVFVSRCRLCLCWYLCGTVPHRCGYAEAR